MKLLPLLACCILVLAFSSCEEIEPVPGCMDPFSFNYNAFATEDDGSCIEMAGCLGYTPNLNNSGTLITSLGDTWYDQKFAEEVALQREFFVGVPANIWLIQEPSAAYKNAYANTNGDILFGYFMFWELLDQFGELPIAAVLAHEWGHRTQFTLFDAQDYVQPAHKELEADAFAGFYMYLAKQWAWSRVNSYYQAVLSFGDYNYNHPQHHGTPQERLDAAYFGVQVGAYAINNNYQFTYKELHEIFNEQIKTVIKPRSDSESTLNFRPEIEFPKGVRLEQARAVFPKI